MAERAGISTPHHDLLQVAGQPVLLSRRFDRAGSIRIPFLSAMSMTGSRDGQCGSYPELVDALTCAALRLRPVSRIAFERARWCQRRYSRRSTERNRRWAGPGENRTWQGGLQMSCRKFHTLAAQGYGRRKPLRM
ncbi:HipA domain-containing protein [Paraburkholderia phosphatilytica]|uniref:HipA domain-containing protein n=1 Tax=Paraburkholderia phosphatilytica TaxID=2282883 RepID=UPI00197E2992